MDKPMTFNEWMGTLGNNALVHANCCRKAFEAGQQSQQAKVEELQKRVDAALKLIESWNKTAFEKTTHWTEGYEEGCYHCAAQLEQALKGGDQ